MKKDEIGEIAGRIWRTLGEKEKVRVSQLPEILKLKSDVVYQALGWLARENKINYNVKGSQTYVSLVDSEIEIFRNLI
jgi:Mn-dependent DtxR family transcriptional regulator